MTHILTMPVVPQQMCICYFDSWIKEIFKLVYLHGNFAIVVDKFGERHFLQAAWVRKEVLKDRKIILQ